MGMPPKLLIASTMKAQRCAFAICPSSTRGFRMPVVVSQWTTATWVIAGSAATALAADPAITHVAVVHCETTTGILNPLVELGQIAKAHRCAFIVDAMSSFGGIPIDFAAAAIDYLVS